MIPLTFLAAFTAISACASLVESMDVAFLFFFAPEERLALTQVQSFVVNDIWNSYLSASFECLSESLLRFGIKKIFCGTMQSALTFATLID